MSYIVECLLHIAISTNVSCAGTIMSSRITVDNMTTKMICSVPKQPLS